MTQFLINILDSLGYNVIAEWQDEFTNKLICGKVKEYDLTASINSESPYIEYSITLTDGNHYMWTPYFGGAPKFCVVPKD